LPSVFNSRRVNTLKEYRIPYLGLKLGKHQFEYTLDNRFFENFDSSEIHGSSIKADVELEKQSTMLILTFQLEGNVDSTCDHCGDDLKISIVASHRLIVKFGDHTGNTDDEILVLGPSEHEVDISQYLYEYAHLALPARHIHENTADCNQESLKRLKEFQVDQTADSQWAALKNLNFDDPEEREFFEEEE